MTDPRFEQLRILEAVLFASTEPRTTRELANHLSGDADVEALLHELGEHYANRGVTLRQVGGSWAFRTAEDLAGKLGVESTVTRKLSRAAIETLAIIAYHQPVTRAEIEEIRGVGLSRGTLDTLLEAGWVRPRGRRQTPGRPVTWWTTEAFLDHFGLARLEDLPGLAELRAAGLIDARPALTALTSRGDLGDPETQDDEAAGDNETQDAATPLDPDFGEDLICENEESASGRDGNHDGSMRD